MNRPARQLTLIDCVGIIVGIIVGAGIFESTPFIARNIGSAAAIPGVWLLGGLIALLGASCYAELVTTYPSAGGDLVFLSHAYGKNMGLLFAWCEFWIIRPGNVGAMAFVFARYGQQLFPLGTEHDDLILAAMAVAGLTIVNLWGAKPGARTQNLLTATKLIGLGGVIVAGLAWPQTNSAPVAALEVTDSGRTASVDTSDQPHVESDSAATVEQPPSNLWLAMVLVLFTYGGWNEVSYVAAEIRDPHRNITRALVGGLSGVTVLYLLVNWAYVRSLGFEQMINSKAIATDVVRPPFGEFGGQLVSLLIAISCLGAINGMIMAGSRIYYALGTQHAAFSFLGRWNSARNTPVWSLLVQGCVGLMLLVLFGRNESGFDRLVMLTAPVYWSFLFLVAASIIYLRYRDPDADRPYRAPLYPLLPILFCLSCGCLVYSSLRHAITEESRALERIWTATVFTSGLAIVAWTKFSGSGGLNVENAEPSNGHDNSRDA